MNLQNEEEFIPFIAHIVATDLDGVIGYDNIIPWDNKDDMKFFIETTTNNIVIMGRKTFESLDNKPLKNRTNIIVSKTLEQPEDNTYYVLKSIDDALHIAYTLALKEMCNVFIIGGSNLYRQTFNLIDKLYISLLNIHVKDNKELDKNELFSYYPIELDREVLYNNHLLEIPKELAIIEVVFNQR